jgi:hypothetical protein
MKWTLVAVAVPVALIAVAALVGSRLPRDHVATVRAKYRATPEAVWAVIADPLSAVAWRRDLKSAESLRSVDGKTAWREEVSSGKVSYVMADADRPRRMTTRITDANLPFGGQWEFSLVPSSGGTELSITERGFVRPALFRVMARYVFGFTSTLERYQRDLGAKLGESVTPEIVARGR